MADLVEAVLTHAQVGKSAIGSEEGSDAEAALAAALENLRRDISTSGATIEYGALPKLPVQPQPLTQLFQNLLSNAIKYRRAEVKPHVKVSAERADEFWLIGVEDNGMGIEPEWYERIFVPAAPARNESGGQRHRIGDVQENSDARGRGNLGGFESRLGVDVLLHHTDSRS